MLIIKGFPMDYHHDDACIKVKEICKVSDLEALFPLQTGLLVLWNAGQPVTIKIDGRQVTLERDAILYLSGPNKFHLDSFQKLNVILFNKAFYDLETDDESIGSKGSLFYAGHTPVVQLQGEYPDMLFQLFSTMKHDVEEPEELTYSILQGLLKRFLVMSVMLLRQQNKFSRIDDASWELLKEYHFLVEKNFRDIIQVSDYARMLNFDQKELSGVFRKIKQPTPSKILNDRRLLEAKRLLRFTDIPVQEIADSLSFSNVSTFSHFFNSHSGINPSGYRSLPD